MQEISSSNPPMVTGICDTKKSRARHHRSLKFGLKLKYLKKGFSMQNNSKKICIEICFDVNYYFIIKIPG